MSIEDMNKNFPFRQSEQYMFEQLVRMTCPIVCRGYVDDGLKWHELCIARAKEALKIIRNV